MIYSRRFLQMCMGNQMPKSPCHRFHIQGTRDRKRPQRLRMTIRIAFGGALFGLMMAWASELRAQDKNPFAGDANAAKVGESQFRANCAFCHGLGARGGGRGPDLSRAQKRHGNGDADLFRTINEGVPGTAMPPNGATQQGVGMTEEEVWQVITYIRSVQNKADAQAAGNAAHGRELFYGSAACASCHMV